MKRLRYRMTAAWLIVSLCLVVVGHIFVQQRVLNGPTRYLTIRNDALAYIAMAEGDFDSVNAPYRYRPTPSILAGALPLDAVSGLRLVSYASLLAFYFLCLWTCHILGIRSSLAILGLLSVWTAPSHLYNYHNPFLTDSFGLAAIAGIVLTLLLGAGLFYLALVLIGITARENIIFIAPSWWLVDRRWRGVAFVAAGITTLVAVRVLIGSSPEDYDMVAYFKKVFPEVGRTENPQLFVKQIYKTWHVRWLLLPAGLVLIENFEMFLKLVVVSVLLGIGGFATSLIATDTFRMFSVLSPVLVVAISVVLSTLMQDRRRGLAAALALALILQAFETPNNSVDAFSLRYVWWFGGGITVLAALFVLRNKMVLAGRSKLNDVRRLGRRAGHQSSVIAGAE